MVAKTNNAVPDRSQQNIDHTHQYSFSQSADNSECSPNLSFYCLISRVSVEISRLCKCYSLDTTNGSSRVRSEKYAVKKIGRNCPVRGLPHF